MSVVPFFLSIMHSYASNLTTQNVMSNFLKCYTNPMEDKSKIIITVKINDSNEQTITLLTSQLIA